MIFKGEASLADDKTGPETGRSPLVFNIQKFSIHDGDGVRTTFFFKGCPLRCAWCHNPESQRFGAELVFYANRCVSCGACAARCPENANRLEDGKLIFSRDLCRAHGACADVCLHDARELAGRRRTVDELVKEALKDRIFYETSGGGVTLSGGEVMVQDMDFVEALCRRLHGEGVSVYIDTCGYAPYENFKRILPWTDLFLYDIKLMDGEAHRKYCGRDNALILENLIRLSRDGARIHIRIPVIGGINDTEAFMAQTAHFLTENHIRAERISLLPYHDYGKSKYENLQRSYAEDGMRVPSAERMEELKKVLEEKGFQGVQIGG